MMKPKLKRNLIQLFGFSLLWGMGGLIFTLVERGVIGDMKVYPSTGVPYVFVNNLIAIPFATFIGGALLFTVDILLIDRWVRKKSFRSIVFFKSVAFLLIVLATTFTAAFLATSTTLGKPLFHPDVVASISQFFGDFAFWSIIIYAGFINVLFVFILEVTRRQGNSVFWNFFSGRYHAPQVERKAFMFLDLKNSTTIAEKLGHQQYCQFLNQFFGDISDTILNSWGTIYQYVGDEVVVFWPWDKRESALQCFFGIQEQLQREYDTYRKSFGYIPEFRVGIHGGNVSIGEVGRLKKDILYIGDLLNATSRIQALCKEKNVDLIVSEDLEIDLAKRFGARESGSSSCTRQPVALWRLPH